MLSFPRADHGRRADLGPDAHALLRALRGWVEERRLAALAEAPDRAGWDAAFAAFRIDRPAAIARIATGCFAALVSALARGARRGLRIAPPCCPWLTADEAALLALVDAATPGSEDGSADARAAWLVRGSTAGALVDAARHLAIILGQAGPIVPQTGAEPGAAADPMPLAGAAD